MNQSCQTLISVLAAADRVMSTNEEKKNEGFFKQNKTGRIVRTTLITLCAGPAKAAGTVTGRSITHGAITAVTALDAVGSKPARGAS